MTESTELSEDQPQSLRARYLAIGASLMLGAVAGIVMNYLVLHSSKPGDHAMVALVIGGMIALICMIAFVDTPPGE